MAKNVLPLFYTGGGPFGPPLQFIDRGSLDNASNELIFCDFVPFNIQQDMSKPFFGFFFKFSKNFALKTFDPQKF